MSSSCFQELTPKFYIHTSELDWSLYIGSQMSMCILCVVTVTAVWPSLDHFSPFYPLYTGIDQPSCKPAEKEGKKVYTGPLSIFFLRSIFRCFHTFILASGGGGIPKLPASKNNNRTKCLPSFLPLLALASLSFLWWKVQNIGCL